MLAAIVSQNSFVLVVVGYRTIIARYVAKRGIAQRCLCETKCQGGGIAPFWGSATLLERVSRDVGYRSDSIAVSRDVYISPFFKRAVFFWGPGNLKVPENTPKSQKTDPKSLKLDFWGPFVHS